MYIHLVEYSIIAWSRTHSDWIAYERTIPHGKNKLSPEHKFEIALCYINLREKNHLVWRETEKSVVYDRPNPAEVGAATGITCTLRWLPTYETRAILS